MVLLGKARLGKLVSMINRNPGSKSFGGPFHLQSVLQLFQPYQPSRSLKEIAFQVAQRVRTHDIRTLKAGHTIFVEF